MTIIISKETKDYFNHLLNLPTNGQEQDWDVELADSSRVREFVDLYREMDQNSDLSREKKSLNGVNLFIFRGYNLFRRTEQTLG